MTNKEFIENLASRTDRTAKETQRITNIFLDVMASALEQGNDFFVSNFGTFEVKKRNERVIVHPATGKKMLVPPKLVMNFRQSNTLKSQVKDMKSQKDS